MGIRPCDFEDMTFAQYCWAVYGWSQQQIQRQRQEWERARWQTWILTSIQLEKKDRKPMDDMRILYQEDEAYLKKFQQRHHVHFADHNNITWKSIENHFPLPMLQTHDSEDIILQFNTFLNQHNNHANTFKYECAIHQTNTNDNR